MDKLQQSLEDKAAAARKRRISLLQNNKNKARVANSKTLQAGTSLTKSTNYTIPPTRRTTVNSKDTTQTASSKVLNVKHTSKINTSNHLPETMSPSCSQVGTKRNANSSGNAVEVMNNKRKLQTTNADALRKPLSNITSSTLNQIPTQHLHQKGASTGKPAVNSQNQSSILQSTIPNYNYNATQHLPRTGFPSSSNLGTKHTIQTSANGANFINNTNQSNTSKTDVVTPTISDLTSSKLNHIPSTRVHHVGNSQCKLSWISISSHFSLRVNMHFTTL